MVGYLQRFTKAGRRMALLRPQQRISALLKLTRLDDVFPIFTGREEALSFAGGD
jgi:anti-anti-sigma regulatory factor